MIKNNEFEKDLRTQMWITRDPDNPEYEVACWSASWAFNKAKNLISDVLSDYTYKTEQVVRILDRLESKQKELGL